MYSGWGRCLSACLSENQSNHLMALAPQQPSLYASVLVDCPAASEAYTYQVPAGWCLQGGEVVEVPFGSQVVRGIVLEVLETVAPSVDPQRLRSLLEVVDQQLFPKDYWALLEQIATYYCTPLIQVVRTALPPGVLGRSQRRVRLRRQQGIPPVRTGATSAALSPDQG